MRPGTLEREAVTAKTFLPYARNVSNYTPRLPREHRARRPCFRTSISTSDCLVDAHLQIVTPTASEGPQREGENALDPKYLPAIAEGRARAPGALLLICFHPRPPVRYRRRLYLRRLFGGGFSLRMPKPAGAPPTHLRHQVGIRLGALQPHCFPRAPRPHSVTNLLRIYSERRIPPPHTPPAHLPFPEAIPPTTRPPPPSPPEVGEEAALVVSEYLAHRPEHARCFIDWTEGDGRDRFRSGLEFWTRCVVPPDSALLQFSVN